MTTLTISTVASDPELAAILRTYNEVTERLRDSHEVLLGEVSRLRDELHEKNRELQRSERLAALGQMAAGVAHEIRNPLGGIGLYAALLGRDLADRPAQQRIAERISSGVQNLEAIVRDILCFAGEVEPRLGNHTLGDILDAVLGQVAPRVETAAACLEIDPALRAVELRCDAAQIERALLNLVFNALDASGPGGFVRVGRGDWPQKRDLATVVVEDNGPGIAADALHRIFNPFFTTKDHGTGLGLAIVHRIAEAHGGHVSARNREAGGASFVLTIPRAGTREAS